MSTLVSNIPLGFGGFVIYNCWEIEANLTYGNHSKGRMNRVMVSFHKFKQVNARDNYMQVYNNQYIDNCI